MRQWLEEALQVFAAEGIDNVRVVDLARRLKISKSGFYWHFGNRDQLLEEMKQFWVDEFSQQIISEIQRSEDSPKDKLNRLVRLIRAKNGGYYDLAFAAWAQSDPSVRDLVDRVWDMRFAFAKKLLAQGGHSGQELEARTRLFLVYFSWSDVMFRQTDGGLEGEHLNTVLEIIIGTSGS